MLIKYLKNNSKLFAPLAGNFLLAESYIICLIETISK